MTTLEDGDVIEQVKQRRRGYNTAEFKLINVLMGEMSLVGPRRHAVAHDRIFEKRIADYPRRLNVKSGITGWAQVNGFRGATMTDEAMRRRVERPLLHRQLLTRPRSVRAVRLQFADAIASDGRLLGFCCCWPVRREDDKECN